MDEETVLFTSGLTSSINHVNSSFDPGSGRIETPTYV